VRAVRHGVVARLVLVALAGGILAACGSGVSVTSVQGTITGVASACPATTSSSLAVDVLEDGSYRTSETITAGASYSFTLPPGHYVVLTKFARSAKTIVHAGAVVRVDLTPTCQ
jgi:hypothetical protein